MHKIGRPVAYLFIPAFFMAQILLSNLITTSAIKPNFMILITAFFALFTDKRFGRRVGIISGLLLDIFSVRLFGLNTILFGLGGYFIGKYNIKFYRKSAITHLIITFAMSLLVLVPHFLIINLRNPASSYSGLGIIFNAPILISAALNSILGVFLYAYLCRIFRLNEYDL